MKLSRYEGDPRSIPTLGGSEGMVEIGSGCHFSVAEHNLVLRDPENGNEPVNIGTQMQYIVS